MGGWRSDGEGGVMGGGRSDGDGGVMGEERVMEWVGKMKRGSGGEWWRREGGVVDSDEWGEGGGVGT